MGRYRELRNKLTALTSKKLTAIPSLSQSFVGRKEDFEKQLIQLVQKGWLSFHRGSFRIHQMIQDKFELCSQFLLYHSGSISVHFFSYKLFIWSGQVANVAVRFGTDVHSTS